MKKKIYKIMGVALIVVLLGSLTIGLAVPAAADPGTLKWTKVTLPQVEVWGDHASFIASEGDFWATPETDVGPIAISPDGDIMFAAVAEDDYIGWFGPPSDWYDVLKSTDGGYSWVVTGFYDEWFVARPGDNPDNTCIVDIVVSPDYEEDTTVFVATEWSVYQSVDGGKNFVCMEDSPIWGGMIRDLDVALDDRGRVAIMVGTWGGGPWTDSDVFVFATATGMKWTPQLIDVDIDGDTVDDPGDGDIDYDVLACAFSPNFADDEGICAVVTGLNHSSGNWETKMRFAFAYTADGGGWGTDIADARFTEADADDFYSEHARIGFPDDFDPWGIGNNVCFVGITTQIDRATYAPDWGDDVYKVVLKESGTSSAIDLDVRGVVTTLLPTATAIATIEVCGPAEEATILVGTDTCNLNDTPMSFLVYYSTDSGENWDAAAKPPTGGYEDTANLVYRLAMTRVLMAPDFCESGIAYAATWDSGDYTSAFSRTTATEPDGKPSLAAWNQISLIDYGYSDTGYVVEDFDAKGYTAADILHMTTTSGDTGSYGAVWKRTDGKNWERILSYANPGVTDDIDEQIINGDETMFAIDYSVPCMWRSSDNGATWPKKISTKDALTEVVIVSPTEIYTGHGNGEVWWSTKSGVGWTKPEDSEIPSTLAVIYMVVKGDMVLVSTTDGKVFISSDGGETIERVGKTGPGDAGPPALATFGFGTTDLLYATQVVFAGVGVWRCEVDFADPSSSEWERIDDSTLQPVTDPDYDPATVEASGPAIALPPSGVLYITDAAGGLWRSTNPTADVDGAHPPYFEKAVKGLDILGVGLYDLDLAPPSLAPTFFCEWYGAATIDPPGPVTWEYYNQVVMFTDTLHCGVTLADPGDAATGVGLLPAGKTYPKVKLVWEEMARAISYQWQIAIDSGFKSVVDSGFTSSLVSDTLTLSPNKTYYWRVRVAAESSLIGAPLISPFSETWKFKTAIGATMARPDLEAPWAGEPDVSLSPTFEWSGIEWAETYEFELSTGSSTTAGGYFTDVLVGLTGTNALVSTAWKCDIALDYETRYYWHVKAFGVDTETPWSDVGTFTTMAVPAEPVEPGPPVVIPPVEEITPIWLWVIIGIGAALMIAVIILIVTTRRIP